MLGPENDKQNVLFIQPVFKIIFGVIKQIYHVWKGYLRKLPILRLNFKTEIVRLSTGIKKLNPLLRNTSGFQT
jgi:hypothetical protein